MEENVLHPTLYSVEGADEFPAAKWFCRMIENAALPADGASFALHSNVYFPKGINRQVDLFLRAYFPVPLVRTIRLSPKAVPFVVSISNVLCTIEVKRHSGFTPDGSETVKLTETSALTAYQDRTTGQLIWKDALAQSNGQFFAAKEFIAEKTGWTPWVCNLILFPNLPKSFLPAEPSLFLNGDSTFDDFLAALCLSRRLQQPRKSGVTLSFTCSEPASPAVLQDRYAAVGKLLGGVPYDPDAPRYQPVPFRHRPSTSKPSFAHSSPPPTAAVLHAPPVTVSAQAIAPKWKGKVSLIAIATAALLLVLYAGVLLVRGVTHLATHLATRVAAKVSQRLQPTGDSIRLCDSSAAFASCPLDGTFHLGSTLYLQSGDPTQEWLAASVLDPLGHTTSLTLRLPASSAFRQNGSVTKYHLRRGAPIGTYTVHLILRSRLTRQQAILSRPFIVVR